MEALKVKHSFNSGDLITILPGLKHLYDTTGRKSTIMQVLNFEAFYYDGCKHSVKNSEGKDVTMNGYMWERLIPLLLSQDYIESCEVWEGQLFDISFDETRDRRSIPMPNGSIHHWAFYLVPELQCDLSVAWIDLPDLKLTHSLKDKLLVNRTERYQNPYINYYFLKQYETRLAFIGTKQEYISFKEKWGVDIEYYEIRHFLELAIIIKSAKGLLCNQSFCFHLADSMKTHRILEVCNVFPNTNPTGANGYSFLYQQAVELYVSKLFNQ